MFLGSLKEHVICKNAIRAPKVAIVIMEINVARVGTYHIFSAVTVEVSMMPRNSRNRNRPAPNYCCQHKMLHRDGCNEIMKKHVAKDPFSNCPLTCWVNARAWLAPPSPTSSVAWKYCKIKCNIDSGGRRHVLKNARISGTKCEVTIYTNKHQENATYLRKVCIR